MFGKIAQAADILMESFGNDLVITWDGAMVFFATHSCCVSFTVSELSQHSAQGIAKIVASRFNYCR